jgi:putative ABC transport system permease protein
MRPVAFAWRRLSAQPARTALGILGVAAIGALLLDMLLLARGLERSFTDLLESTGYDVRVTATAALPTFGPPLEDTNALVETVRRLPEIQLVAPIHVAELRPVAAPDLRITGLGTGADANASWRILRGRGLSAAAETAEVVVDVDLAQRLALAPGAGLSLVLGTAGSVLPPVELTVVGIVEFPFETADEMTVATSLGVMARLLGTERVDADILLVAAQPSAGSQAAAAAIRRVRPDLHTVTNEELISRLRRADFAYFRQVSAVLSTLTLGFTVLLLATLLTVAVNQRFAEIAALRALGFSRRRVVADLVCESMLLAGAGAAAAVPLGLGLARVLDAILRSMPTIPERVHFFVAEPRAFVLHAALLGAAALAAAAYPMFLAARLPIAATLRREFVS